MAAALGVLLASLAAWPAASVRADEPQSHQFRGPYVAPPYEAPAPAPAPSAVQLVDNGNGTLTDRSTGLMWAQKDSYADLGRCLAYTEARQYVQELKTGGHGDWRMPTLDELASIYDPTQENVKAWDKNPDYPLALDKLFADGAAYWYWSSDCGLPDLAITCGKTLYFVNGKVDFRQFDLCNNGGVRAVRNAFLPPKP